jgi:hypothetical protein
MKAVRYRADIARYTAGVLRAVDVYHREQHGIRTCKRCGSDVPPFRTCPCAKQTKHANG